MIALVWNDLPATQVQAAAAEVVRHAENPEGEATAKAWLRATLTAATNLDPAESGPASFAALAAALRAVRDDALLTEAGELLQENAPALALVALVAQERGLTDLADRLMVRSLLKTALLAWPTALAYQRAWKAHFHEQLVSMLSATWKKLKSRALAKQAVEAAQGAAGLESETVAKELEALLAPADLWPQSTRGQRSQRGRRRAASAGGASRSRSSRQRRSTKAEQSSSPAPTEESPASR